VWLGNFGYNSNWNGLEAFLRDGWPILQTAGWRLHLIGSDLSDRQRDVLARIRGVVPRGFVVDLAAELAVAQAGIVPIWSGGGTKMKTLTMMSHGLPVVSTPSGAEGVPLDSAQPAVLVAESAHALAVTLRDAEESALAQIGRKGRRLVESNFSDSALACHVRRLLDLVAGPGARRLSPE
jgi:glycosyltransferase involved in cell wall biosynthesis